MNWATCLRLLSNLPARHLSALNWFDQHRGQVLGWPDPLPDGTLLTTKPKGIYKPVWSKYALSVRQSLAGPYPDRDIEERTNGQWKFEYFQEDLDPDERDSQFTNIGLIECWKDVVPVGVIIQVKPRPNPRYRIMGLALIAGWESGYFILESFHNQFGKDLPKITEAPNAAYRAEAIAEVFDPSDMTDMRKEIMRSVKTRQGQQGFRRTLLATYEGRCAISGYDAEEALEAVHIVPYRGPVTNHPTNGLLLRADLHSLFDLGLLAVNKDTHRIILDRDIEQTSYGAELKESVLRRPINEAFRPSLIALEKHRLWADSLVRGGLRR